MMILGLRTIIFICIALIIQIGMNSTPIFKDTIFSSPLVYPVLFGLVPFIFAKFPILGTKDLASNVPTGPFLSTILLAGLGYLGFIMLKVMGEKKTADIELGPFTIDRDSFIIIIFAFVVELLIQLGYGKYAQKLANSRHKKVTMKALNNYFKK
jgi:hypothetical protein